MAIKNHNARSVSDSLERYHVKAICFQCCILVTVLLLGLLPLTAQATNCTYRDDTLGNTRYQCDNGKHGTLRKDSLGNVKDTATNTIWRKDSLGNIKGSDGTTYRQDSLGNVRGNNYKSGERITWRKDSLGNLRASDGTVCRPNTQGQLRCDGLSTPPTLLEGK